MKKQNRAFLQNIGTVVLLVLFAVTCHTVARRVDSPEISRFLNFIRTSVYIGLFSVWGVSTRHRIVQPQVRRYLVAVAVLIVGWLVLREIKFRFIADPDAERYLWYAYYIPILLTPLFALFVSILLGKNESYRLPKKLFVLYLPAFILIALFLTNDLHQTAFRFPSDAAVWTEHGSYAYGPVFYAAIACSILCSLTALIFMIVKSNLSKLRGLFWIPLSPVILAVFYVAAYAAKVPLIKSMDDTAVFYGLLFTGFFEICIYFGLIPSNARYFDLFRASQDLSVQIVDDAYVCRYAAHEAEPVDKETMIRAEKEPVLFDGGKWLHTMPIDGGHAVWTEDIRELLQKNEALKEAQSELNDRSEIVAMEYKTEKERRSVEEQNRLLTLLQRATQTQLDKIKALADAYEASKDETRKREIISRIVVLGSFIKRRKDFLLSMEDADVLEEGKLASALDESFRSLRLFGITGGYTVRTGRSAVRGDALATAYDFFEDVLETVMDGAKYLNAVVVPVGGRLRCSVITDCAADGVVLAQKYPAVRMQEDDGGTAFSLALEGGDGP